jgi:hypothetical protein
MLEVREELVRNNVTARVGFGILVRDPVDHILSRLMHDMRSGRFRNITSALDRVKRGEDLDPLKQRKLYNLRHPQCNMVAPVDRPRRAERNLQYLAFVGLQELFVESKYLFLFSSGLLDARTAKQDFERDCQEEAAIMASQASRQTYNGAPTGNGNVGRMDAHLSRGHARVMLSVADVVAIEALAIEDRSLWVAARRLVFQRLRYMEASLGITLRCSPMAKYGYAIVKEDADQNQDQNQGAREESLLVSTSISTQGSRAG